MIVDVGVETVEFNGGLKTDSSCLLFKLHKTTRTIYSSIGSLLASLIVNVVEHNDVSGSTVTTADPNWSDIDLSLCLAATSSTPVVWLGRYWSLEERDEVSCKNERK